MTTEDTAPVESPEHLKLRPSWDCAVCAQPWPCANAKVSLMTEFQEYPTVLAIYMSSQMHEAFVDLIARGPVRPADLYDRFLGWINFSLSN